MFVVRKGNAKGIHDWPDLVKDGVAVVTPDPRTSGNGQLSFLAGVGLGHHPRRHRRRRRSTTSSRCIGTSRCSTPAPVVRPPASPLQQIGDVHLTWENEALREVADSKGELEIVYPPVSIQAEPAVAWVDANDTDPKTAADAKAYLEYLFTDPAQELFAQYGYRPLKPAILAKHADRLPNLELFPITAIAKDWDDAEAKFFGDNGIYDVVSASAPAAPGRIVPNAQGS